MANRLITLDIAKTICIILVVIGHYHPENSPVWYSLIRDVIYSFHMPLFMFASGYIYISTLSVKNTGMEFIIKKVRRLLVPYFTTSILIISLKLISQKNMYIENPTSYLSYFKMLYSPEAGYFLWFIWALFLMFVTIPFFKTRSSRIKLFIASIIIHFMDLNITDIFCINQFLGMLMYFMLGVVIAENKEKLKVLAINKIIVIVLFILSEYLYIFATGSFIDSIVKIITPLIGIYSVYIVSDYLALKKISSLFLAVSSSSYIIYLLHTTFQGFTKALILKIQPVYNNQLEFTIAALIIITSGVVMPILVNKYIINKYKITKLLFGLK